MSDIDPFTQQAADRLEHGFQDACGSLSIDIAEVRESIDDPEVQEAMQQAEYCLSVAKRIWWERYDREVGSGTEQ